MDRSYKIASSSFIKRLSERSGISYDDTRSVWKAFLDIMVDDLEDNRTFKIPNFGTFSKVKHKGHPVNLKNADREFKDEMVDDYEVLKFKVGVTFKSKIMEKKKMIDKKEL